MPLAEAHDKANIFLGLMNRIVYFAHYTIYQFIFDSTKGTYLLNIM